MSKCAVTGHRVLGKNFSRERLKKTLLRLISEGTDTFYCGMALGFDTLCCELLLQLRREYPVKIVACVPCADQAARYGERSRQRYEELLVSCDEQIILHKQYEPGCMFERNRYMVDRCDVLLAYLQSERGGTYYTVNYAKKRGKHILFVENEY